MGRNLKNIPFHELHFYLVPLNQDSSIAKTILVRLNSFIIFLSLWTFETNMEHLWNTYGTPMEQLWNTYGTPLEHLYNTYGKPIEHLWNTYGTPMEHLWNTYETPIEHLWNPYGTPMKPIWNTYETPMEHLWNNYITPKCNARMRRTSVFITLVGFRFCQLLKYLFNNYYVEADILNLLCDMYRGCTLGFYTVHSVHKPYCIPHLQYYTHYLNKF